MKITYFVNQFPKLSETFVLGQITGLIDRGHDIEIISITEPSEETVHEDISKYNLLEKTHYINKSRSILGFIPDQKLVSALFFTDIIHAHFAGNPASWALKISQSFGIPFVFTAHAYDIFIDPDVEDLKEKFGNAAKIITISDYNTEYLLNMLGKEFEEKIEVIRCGIDLTNFNYVERTHNDIVKILFVGRLVEKKGPLYAIEALNNLTKERNNIELRMIGDGPLKGEITSLIGKLNLGDKVHLLGAQPQSRVLKEMEEADIFFLPSLTAENGDREGSPVSILEAQATGLPIVSTIHTGIPEIVIDGKTGFLVPEKDTNAMTESLKKLIPDPELRIKMGKAGRAHVETYHDREKEIDELEKLFHNLLQNRPLISEISQDRLSILEERIKNTGVQLSSLDNEIRQKIKEIYQRDKEIKQKNNEINQKDEQLKHLEERLARIESTLGYRMYISVDRFFKRIARRLKKVY